MTESRVETHFDKGARILNAVLAEVDLSADLKGSAQSVISMLAELLPRLLAQPAAPPTTTPATTESRASADPDDHPGCQEALATAFEATVTHARVGRSSRVKPAPPAAKPGRAARPQAQDAAASAVPAEVPEADVKLIWNAYAMALGLQRSHAEQLSAALVVALRARTDPARVVEVLISASSGSARLWRAALDDLAKA